MNGITKNGRRGGMIMFVVIGILMIASWVCLEHSGRLLKLVSVQRETMQRLRASDVPSRAQAQAPCEVSRPDGVMPEREGAGE